MDVCQSDVANNDKTTFNKIYIFGLSACFFFICFNLERLYTFACIRFHADLYFKYSIISDTIMHEIKDRIQQPTNREFPEIISPT